MIVILTLRAAAYALVAAISILGLSDRASAEVSLDGTFVASKECPAFQSFRKQTNPGDVRIEAGQSYKLIAGNAPAPTHYRVEIEGASPPERWVDADCGSVSGAEQATASGAAAEAPAKLKQPAVILSLSWEPGFCATMSDKTECAAETPLGFDATHLSLHGLWPQPRGKQYCKVDRNVVDTDRRHDWKDLPAVTLSAIVRQHLEQVMPGTQSFLERHEWIKHGTCYYGEDAETYFTEAEALVDEVNSSPVRNLFVSHAGKALSASDVRAAFDAAFGNGAGSRVRLSCTRDGSRRLLTEITIGLSGRLESGKKLSNLMLGALGSDNVGCPTGLVIAVSSHP